MLRAGIADLEIGVRRSEFGCRRRAELEAGGKFAAFGGRCAAVEEFVGNGGLLQAAGEFIEWIMEGRKDNDLFATAEDLFNEGERSGDLGAIRGAAAEWEKP